MSNIKEKEEKDGDKVERKSKIKRKNDRKNKQRRKTAEKGEEETKEEKKRKEVKRLIFIRINHTVIIQGHKRELTHNSVCWCVPTC